MAKFVLVVLVAFVAVQLSYAVPLAEDTTTTKSETTEAPTKKPGDVTIQQHTSEPPTPGPRESEAKVDAVDAAEKVAVPEPAAEVKA